MEWKKSKKKTIFNWQRRFSILATIFEWVVRRKEERKKSYLFYGVQYIRVVLSTYISCLCHIHININQRLILDAKCTKQLQLLFVCHWGENATFSFSYSNMKI